MVVLVGAAFGHKSHGDDDCNSPNNDERKQALEVRTKDVAEHGEEGEGRMPGRGVWRLSRAGRRAGAISSSDLHRRRWPNLSSGARMPLDIPHGRGAPL